MEYWIIQGRAARRGGRGSRVAQWQRAGSWWQRGARGREQEQQYQEGQRVAGARACAVAVAVAVAEAVAGAVVAAVVSVTARQ